MADILTNVGTFVTQAVSWMGKFLAQIAGFTTTSSGDAAVTTLTNPILFIFVVCVPLCGLGVGLLNRLIHTRG